MTSINHNLLPAACLHYLYEALSRRLLGRSRLVKPAQWESDERIGQQTHTVDGVRSTSVSPSVPVSCLRGQRSGLKRLSDRR